MKIASEIAAIQYPLAGGNSYSRKAGLESIIAEKLEPVRAALSQLGWSGGAMEWLEMHSPNVRESIDAAIAMFEESDAAPK